MNLENIKRVKLTELPTPLDETPKLAKEIGLSKLYIKRDDCTNLAMGGNKVRKLEYLMADALEKGTDVVMTDGGTQSNHARLTAAAACKVGINKCILFLGGPKFVRMSGNMILDEIFGAEIRFMEDATVKQMESAMAKEAEKLKMQGFKPYVIPIGGSTPLGALGYVMAMKELSEQLSDKDKNAQIFVAVGSAGTFAGCSLGVRLFLPNAKLIGISVARKSKPSRETAAKTANESALLIDSKIVIDPSELIIIDKYYGERYGIPSEAGNDAISLAGRTEALLLDPIYTGKAMSGLIDMAKNKLIDTNRTCIYIHTGGTPALFADY